MVQSVNNEIAIAFAVCHQQNITADASIFFFQISAIFSLSCKILLVCEQKREFLC